MYVHYKFPLSHRTSMVEKKIIGCLSVSLSTLLPHTLALPLPFTAGCASTCLGKSQSQILKLKKVQFVCL